MKAIIIEAYGDIEQFKEADLPEPEISGQEVLVEVHAVAVNPIDWKIRAGYMQDYLPFDMPIVFGWDVSGVVKKVGAQVTDFGTGDEVLARADLKKPGAFAELIAIDEAQLVKKPENVPFEEAAAIPLAGMTAWQMLFEKAKLITGETVLIHGGAGGIGIFAIQLAKRAGANVITTGSGRNRDFLIALGADKFIDYQKEDFQTVVDRADAVLDLIGGDVLERSYGVLKRGGRLVSIAGHPDPDLAEQMGIKTSYLNSKIKIEQLEELIGLVSNGQLKVVLADVLPFTLDGVRQAHALSETGHTRGKIIVKVK
ncbi:MAG TPA: NADP-dependent oxidoreductase [Planococcus sp. (in: firmicutes)]|nr:NADP-dependent oxidoreductase [Planococcus sp. (in: firmicutes)]